jgi:hypothetical protein
VVINQRGEGTQIFVGHIVIPDRHPFESGVGPQPIQTQEQPFLDGLTIEVFAPGQAFKDIGEVQARIASPSAVADLLLEGLEVGWAGLGGEGREFDPAAGFWQNADRGILLRVEILFEHGQGGFMLLLESADEGRAVQWQLQVRIVGCSPFDEILREVLSRIAMAIRSNDPDFFTAEFVSEGLEHTDLVVDPMDLYPATPGATDHEIPPDIGDDTVERWVILGRIIRSHHFPHTV